MLDRIFPQGQWPYTTWGMARRAGNTATYTIEDWVRDVEGFTNRGATILVPLQWNPRPLGKQSSLLQLSATQPGINTIAPNLKISSLEKRNTGNTLNNPITPRGSDPVVDCGMSQSCRDFFLSLEMAFNATGGIRDPNDIDRSRAFQTMWCGVNTNNTK
jgi:hypothetical protein